MDPIRFPGKDSKKNEAEAITEEILMGTEKRHPPSDLGVPKSLKPGEQKISTRRFVMGNLRESKNLKSNLKAESFMASGLARTSWMWYPTAQARELKVTCETTSKLKTA